jgi:hypothetical protein
MDLMNSQRKSHTHLQFAQASATTKNCKRVCLANPRGDKERQSTHPPNNVYKSLGSKLLKWK